MFPYDVSLRRCTSPSKSSRCTQIQVSPFRPKTSRETVDVPIQGWRDKSDQALGRMKATALVVPEEAGEPCVSVQEDCEWSYEFKTVVTLKSIEFGPDVNSMEADHFCNIGHTLLHVFWRREDFYWRIEITSGAGKLCPKATNVRKWPFV